MAESLKALIDAWVSAYAKGSQEDARSLFLPERFGVPEANGVDLPESARLIPEGLLFSGHLERVEDLGHCAYRVFFRMDVDVAFEGAMTTCDSQKYDMKAVRWKDGQHRIAKLSEVDVYPWDLDQFDSLTMRFGRLYWLPMDEFDAASFARLAEGSLQVLARLFGDSPLDDLGIVVFPTSSALTAFLNLKVHWGEMVGKAKQDHVFLVHTENTHTMGALLRHEVSHVAIVRAAGHAVNGWLFEALGEAAAQEFHFEAIRPGWKKAVPEWNLTLAKLDNHSVKDAKERTTRILQAVALLDFIQACYGDDCIIPFVVRSRQIGSLECIVHEVFAVAPMEFEAQWIEYVMR